MAGELQVILQILKVIIDLEQKIEKYIGEEKDEKRIKAIRAAVAARDVDAINRLIVG